MTKIAREKLFIYNGGFLTQSRVRRILQLSGFDIRLGSPGEGDLVGVWGQSPTAPRGEKVADRAAAKLVRIEDSFLRSVKPGRDGDPPIGLNIDRNGVHFDPSTISDLETILTEDPLDDTVLLDRARAGMALMQKHQITKYNATDPARPVPAPGYVLVLDQTRKDASVKASGADSNTFREMLFYAMTENPGAQIVIKTHPETQAGHRDGYFKPEDTDSRITICDAPLSPWVLFEGATAVYTVSSQAGFEAIFAGHRPVVFGQPFYVGWGLTDDRKPLQRRQRNLTRAQLFAAAMILYPTWYDPFHDRLCSFEEALATLISQSRAWREDQHGWVAKGMRLWKRKPIQDVFGTAKPVRFLRSGQTPPAQHVMQWATAQGSEGVMVEDGFLRSRGLGADLVAPLSLVLDDRGMYYDATRPSKLEDLINQSDSLTQAERDRAEALITRITDAGLSKYNLGNSDLPALPKGRRILVPGQVADDASLALGASKITDNAALLEAVRAANPAAVLIYKPHPDVEKGLRPGGSCDAESLADVVLRDTDPVAAIDAVDEVWTMTSLLGFEALLRGKPVTCFGMPFYAGWGLTDDRAMPIPRRIARVDLVALVHAALIAYPRYYDPITKQACPPEVIIDRIENNDLPPRRLGNRALAKAQGLLSGYAYIWRR